MVVSFQLSYAHFALTVSVSVSVYHSPSIERQESGEVKGRAAQWTRVGGAQPQVRGTGVDF